MRPQRLLNHVPRRRENDCAAKTFETYEAGSTVTGVRVLTRPVKLWLTSARDGALAMLTVTPRVDGGYDLELASDQSKAFELQGLPFDTVTFNVTAAEKGGASPLAPGTEPKALDLDALTVEEDAPEGAAVS